MFLAVYNFKFKFMLKNVVFYFYVRYNLEVNLFPLIRLILEVKFGKDPSLKNR